MSSRINVGDQYENFESLQKEVTLYENETYVNLRKSDSQLIKSQEYVPRSNLLKIKILFLSVLITDETMNKELGQPWP